MNEIAKTDAITQSNWQEERQNYPESGKRNPYVETEKAVASKERSGGDIASILGISPAAINAEIKEAVSSLLDQLDFLRKQTQKAVARANFLETQVDMDSQLPLMNVRAFTRELARRVEHSKRVGFKCSLVLFYYEDFEYYRTNLGLKAANSIFNNIIVTLRSYLRASDVVGLVGFATFGVVMPLLAKFDAREKAQQIVDLINTKTTNIHNNEIPFKLKFATYEASENDTAETVIDSADKMLVKILKKD